MTVLPVVDLSSIPPGRKDLSQWHTRSPLAGRLVDFARLQWGDRVLEPSAGVGRIARMVPRSCSLTAVEIDPRLVAHLEAHGRQRDWRVVRADFLEWSAQNDPTREPTARAAVAARRRQLARVPRRAGMFHVAVMNPPFEDDQDAAHVLSALAICERVIALVRAQFLFGALRDEAIWQWHRLRRMAVLAHRPPFDGVLEASGSPRHDFVVVEIVPRLASEMGRPDHVEVERWRDRW